MNLNKLSYISFFFRLKIKLFVEYQPDFFLMFCKKISSNFVFFHFVYIFIFLFDKKATEVLCIRQPITPNCFQRCQDIAVHCDTRYLGCTSQRLQDRIRQHVPKFIKTGQIPNSRNISTRSGKSSTPVMFSEFAIDQHLLNNPMCAKN